MEDELKMIPTSYRTKIPHALSYSCGAKMLSLAWQDVTQFEFLDLQFSCDVPRALYKTSGWRHILGIHYSPWRPAQIPRFREQRENGESLWNVSVGVCRREDAHEVREWLRDAGLEQAHLWLQQQAHLPGEPGWSAAFDEDSRTFRVSHG